MNMKACKLRSLVLLGVLAFGATWGMAAADGAKGGVVEAASAIETEAACKSFLASLPDPGSDEGQLAAGICYHNLARANPEAWLKPARQILEKSARTSAIGQAYLGSVQTIAGGAAIKQGDVAAATAGVEQGLKNIDDALAKEPGNVTIRILRLSNGLEVAKASPWQRYDLLRQDADFLIAKLKGFTPDLQSQVWCLAGDLALATKKLDAALDNYDRAARAAPASAFGKKARAALANLEE
jgi:hypothetical protein